MKDSGFSGNTSIVSTLISMLIFLGLAFRCSAQTEVAYKELSYYPSVAAWQAGEASTLVGSIENVEFPLDSIPRYRIVTPKKQGKANKIPFYEDSGNLYINAFHYSFGGTHHIIADTMLKHYALCVDADPDKTGSGSTPYSVAGGILGGAIGGAIAGAASASARQKLLLVEYIVILDQDLYYVVSPVIMKAICRGHDDVYDAWNADQSRENTIRTLVIMDQFREEAIHGAKRE